jgi:hypothetical protein
MATPNLFDTAKVLETKASAGKKPAKSRTLIEGLELYAAIDHSIKWLKTTLETAKVTVIDAALEKFIADGIATKAKPGSFDAEEGKATGNLQFKKRSSASGLNPIERDLCETHKVPTEELADRPEGILWNQAHDAWLQANSAKISAALAKLDAPADIFLKQTASTKVVTTDDSIDFVFRTYAKKPDILAQLIPVVATLAVKAKYDAGDDSVNDTALDAIKEFLG